MVTDAIPILNQVFTAVSLWFTQVLTAVGGAGLLLGIMFILMCVRYLLGPLFGAGSDRAGKRKKDGDE